MSAPKLPPRSSTGAPPQRAQSSPQQNAKKGSGRSGSNSLRASPLPLVLGIVSVGFGLILLAIAVGEDNGGTLVLEGVMGYLMAGFATPLLWGWDAAAQRRGRINPNFASRRNYSSILRVLALAGILISVIHLLLISIPIAERVSEWLYISGIVGV